MRTTTIVFITGAFLNNSIWDDWRIFFETNGYITIAPPWPYKDATTRELRSRHPDTAIASIDLQQLVGYYSGIIKLLPEKAILIGHSVGGLVTQLLLQQDLAVAGIVIHSVPPKGVMIFKFSFLLSAWNSFGFFTPVKDSFLMSFSQWQYAYTNGMSLSRQQSGYEQFVVPESKRVLRDIVKGIATIDFKRRHVPLLFVSGSDDHFMPASVNFSNYKNYPRNGSVTDYRNFKGKNHFVLRQPGWQEEATFILDWIKKQEESFC